MLKKFVKDFKAQGALEYLLLLAGIILGVAIVLAILLKSSDTGMDDANRTFDDFNDIRNAARTN